MEKRSWFILFVILALIVLVVVFWDKFLIRSEEVVSADYCKQDSDCVLAVNPYLCCVLPYPVSREAVDSDDRLVLYEQGVDYLYDYPKDEQCFNEDGRGMIRGCVTLEVSNKTLSCINNKCSFTSEN